MIDADDSARRQEVAAYNVALDTARLNLLCLTATEALATGKQDLRALTVRNLQGSVAWREQQQKVDASTTLDNVIAKQTAKHQSVLRQIESDADEHRRELQHQLEAATSRVRAARDDADEARGIIDAAGDIPRFDVDAIGDAAAVEKLRRNIDASRQTISRLEARLESIRNRPKATIRDILDTTSPPAFRIRSRRSE
jgi:gas vesicle protein